eukprot:scaffold79343_cov51-Phaeocystis_antarctica.AAC.2
MHAHPPPRSAGARGDAVVWVGGGARPEGAQRHLAQHCGGEWSLEDLGQVGGLRLGRRRRPASEEPEETRRQRACVRGVAYAIEEHHELGGARGDGGGDASTLGVRAIDHTVHGGGGERIDRLLALAAEKLRPPGALEAHGTRSSPTSAVASAATQPATHAPPRKAEEAAATRLTGSMPALRLLNGPPTPQELSVVLLPSPLLLLLMTSLVVVASQELRCTSSKGTAGHRGGGDIAEGRLALEPGAQGDAVGGGGVQRQRHRPACPRKVARLRVDRLGLVEARLVPRAAELPEAPSLAGSAEEIGAAEAEIDEAGIDEAELGAAEIGAAGEV